MKTSAKIIEFIASYEGLSLTAYQCPAGKWTIGYGHTGGVRPGDKINRHQALDLLREDVDFAERAVTKVTDIVKLKQNQYDALVSLVYNIGSEAFRTSTLRKMIMNDPYDPMIKVEWLRWIRSNGRVLPGLQRRRLDEYSIYSVGWQA